MARTKKIAVIGFGNIGTGVVRLLYEKGIAGLELVRVVDTDIKTRRSVELPASYLSTDWRQVVADPNIDIVVELIGGIEPAKSILSKALKQGKDVVKIGR